MHVLAGGAAGVRAVVLRGRYHAYDRAPPPAPAPRCSDSAPAPRGGRTHMAAVVATHQAPWREALRVQPAPQLGPPPAGCLQVDVVAAGLAFPDVLRIEGKHFHRPEYPFVPCQEVAGQVRAVGEGVEGWKVGQRVFGTVSTGALSPIAHMDARGAYPIPDRVSDEIAAGFELNYGTAFHSIHDLATARPGERLLVLGAGGQCCSQSLSPLPPCWAGHFPCWREGGRVH